MLKNKNDGKSTLFSGITDVATSLQVASGHGIKFSATGTFRARIWGSAYLSPTDDPTTETITMTLDSGDTFTIVREVEDVATHPKKAWNASDNIAQIITAGKVDEIETLALGCEASDILQISADTERNSSSESYELKKEILVKRIGVVRVKFDLKIGTAGGGKTAYGKVYRNSGAVGTERTDTTGSYQTFSQDIAVLDLTDVIQIYLHKNSGGTSNAYCRNFRIYFDPAPITPVVNTD